MEFYKEIINLENIREYKELIDSIRYICNFNGFDPDFEYDEDIKNPSIPENGKLENNHFVGYRLYVCRCFYLPCRTGLLADQQFAAAES
jgi:hypothetical protein